MGGLAVWTVLGLGIVVTWALTLPPRFTTAGTLEIEAPIRTVYGAVSDGRGVGARWGPGFESLSNSTSDWTAGIDTTAVQAASQFAHQIRETDRPRSFVTEYLDTSGRVGTSTWTFEALGPSTTRVTVVQDAEVPQPLTRALSSLQRSGHADIRDQLGALRQALTGGEQS